MEIYMNVRLTMCDDHLYPAKTYIVDVTKVDEVGYHGYYRVDGDIGGWELLPHTKLRATGIFMWDQIFSMEKL
jgi:hypothetical protein